MDVTDCPECGRNLPVGKKRCIYCGGIAPDGIPVSEETERGPGRSGENRTHVEQWTVSPSQGDLEEDNGTFQGTEFGEFPDREENDQPIPFALETGKSIKPMKRVLLVLIFFASMAVMGALVWLIG